MKKLLFVNYEKSGIRLQELEALKVNANRLVSLLAEFGITDHEAMKNPGEAVIIKLETIISEKSLLSVLPERAASLIGKEKEYQEIIELSHSVVYTSDFSKLRFNKTQYSLVGNAEKQITEECSDYLTDPEEIDLANRIEKFIKDAEDISYETSARPMQPSRLLALIPVLRIYRGKVVIDPLRFKKMIFKEAVI